MRFALILLLFAGLLFTSCSSKNMSDREENIFKQDFQTIRIPVDSFVTLGDLTDYLLEEYCEKKVQYWPYILFDTENNIMVSESNRNTIELGIEPPPCVQGVFDDKMVLEIVKDGYNTEIERIITEVDSIPSFVEKQMLSFGADYNYAVGAYNNGIWLSTKRDDKLTNLNPYIAKIVEGYLNSVRKYSVMAYSKPIDKLTDEEYEELAREFNFRMSFKYTDKPPVLELEN